MIESLTARMTKDSETGCWIWSGTPSQRYGQIRMPNGKNELVHRLAWKLWCGPIPDGAWVCHRCDTPRCINPVHLFLGDAKANSADRHRKGRTVGAFRRGEEHSLSKLSLDQVKEIIRKWDGSRSYSTRVAQGYHVHPNTIRDVIRRRTWGWVN